MAKGKERPGTGCRLLGRELRIRRGKRSLAEMARLTSSPPLAGRVQSLTGSTLHKYEQGERMPSVQALRTLSLLYGLTPDHMFRLIEAEELGDIQPEGDTVEELIQESRDTMGLGDYRASFAAALTAEELADDPVDRSRAVINKACSLWKLGLPQLAATELNDLLADEGLPAQERIIALYNVACIYRSLWNLPIAEMYSRHGMELAKRAGSALVIAHQRRLLGNILCDRAESETARDRRRALVGEAIRLYEMATQEYERLDDAPQAAVSISNAGVAFLAEGNLVLGFQRLREGLRACRECGNKRGAAFSLKELGKAYRSAGEWKAARRHLLDAESLAAAGGYLDIQFQALVHLAEGAIENEEDPIPMLRRARRILPFLQDRFPERQRFEQDLLPLTAQGGAA